jgi:hypothetical protein
MKIMNSSGSTDNEEFLGNSSLLQELPVREYPVRPVSVNRYNFGQYHHVYKELRNYPSRFFEYLRTVIETLL